MQLNSVLRERLQNTDKKDAIELYYQLLTSGHSVGEILDALNSTQSKSSPSDTATAEYLPAESDSIPTIIAAEVASVQAVQAKARSIPGLSTAQAADDGGTEHARAADATPLKGAEPENREGFPISLCGSEPDILARAASQTSTNRGEPCRPGDEEQNRPGKFPGVARRIKFGTGYAAAIASAAIVGFSIMQIARDNPLTSVHALSNIFGFGGIEAGATPHAGAGRAEAVENDRDMKTPAADADMSHASEPLRPAELIPAIPHPAQRVVAEVQMASPAVQPSAQEIHGSQEDQPNATQVSALAVMAFDALARDETPASATAPSPAPAPEPRNVEAATVAGAEHRIETDRGGMPVASFAETGARAEPPDAASPPVREAAAPDPAPRLQEITPKEMPFKTAEADTLVTRGDAFFTAGDLASARLFYEYAVAAGNGVAALRLGGTFDPGFLARAQIGRVQGDVAIASYWYRRARDLGNGDAEILLRKMEQSAQ